MATKCVISRLIIVEMSTWPYEHYRHLLSPYLNINHLKNGEATGQNVIGSVSVGLKFMSYPLYLIYCHLNEDRRRI